ncbi:dihydropteroate synthase [Flavobacterium sp. NKUCC04_CG]|uniref:dihydropteroate synthase n=1 Tax=Flavobacterium sp. NKUCC04_CG TaxID=2842121 RepID=UPI001C5BF361|nr:dihydropteroate synthase [Flavobacterium sp. NKUCC04_CG]MBW3520213.1 dihydropteroate synthase [Flavobacterium sp. NKUCC04_CG]
MTINCLGNLVDISTPKVMGILNTTPNSFFDGGKYRTDLDFLNQAEKMLMDGATFIDIGAYSSKPNAEWVSEEQETQRLLPVINLILKEFPQTIISVDTFRSKVAESAVDNGAALINDISAGYLDSKMLEVIGRLNVPYIMMHMRGTPNTMVTLTDYKDIVAEMNFYFSERVASARRFGIKDIILDPGYGFAKTTEQNFEVLKNQQLFSLLGLPLLVGVSRKSMIYKLLEIGPEDALNGTSVLHAVALTKKTNILRVHDVKEAVQTIQLMQFLK